MHLITRVSSSRCRPLLGHLLQHELVVDLEGLVIKNTAAAFVVILIVGAFKDALVVAILWLWLADLGSAIAPGVVHPEGAVKQLCRR